MTTPKIPLRLYVETSVWSRVVDRRDPVRRRATRKFVAWAIPRHFLFSSRLVLFELEHTQDPEMRRQVVRRYRDVRKRDIPTLSAVRDAAWELVRRGCVTENHLADAFHLGYAIAGRMDALITWNLRDLARPHTRKIVSDYCWQCGIPGLRIGNPQEVGQWLNVEI